MVGLSLLGLVAGLRAGLGTERTADLGGTAGPGCHWRSSAWAWPCGFCSSSAMFRLRRVAHRPQPCKRDSSSSRWCSWSAAPRCPQDSWWWDCDDRESGPRPKTSGSSLARHPEADRSAPGRGCRRRRDCRRPRYLRLRRGTHSIGGVDAEREGRDLRRLRRRRQHEFPRPTATSLASTATEVLVGRNETSAPRRRRHRREPVDVRPGCLLGFVVLESLAAVAHDRTRGAARKGSGTGDRCG